MLIMTLFIKNNFFQINKKRFNPVQKCRPCQ